MWTHARLYRCGASEVGGHVCCAHPSKTPARCSHNPKLLPNIQPDSTILDGPRNAINLLTTQIHRFCDLNLQALLELGCSTSPTFLYFWKARQSRPQTKAAAQPQTMMHKRRKKARRSHRRTRGVGVGGKEGNRTLIMGNVHWRRDGWWNIVWLKANHEQFCDVLK